jgi:integrase
MVGQEWSNFINSINSPETKRMYVYCLEWFLTYCKLNLEKFLKLPPEQQTNLVINYFVEKKVSKSFKNLNFAAIKHACDMNDVLLNWKKIKKFSKSTKTGNEIAGKDRGYTTQEIQKILSLSDQRFKTAFLILASTGMRIGELTVLKVGDLERIQDLYKVTVYSGEKEEYTTFMTPEASKELDIYLDSRKRKGENISSESYLIVKRSGKSTTKGQPFKGHSLNDLLGDTINNTGLRQVDHNNPYKRRQVPLLHGFRKFFTKQLMDSKCDKAIVELLLGHDIGLTGRYYKPTQQDMLNEYLKAVPLLTISDEERLKFKLEERIAIEKTKIESLTEQFEKFKQEVKAMKRRKK